MELVEEKILGEYFVKWGQSNIFLGRTSKAITIKEKKS